MSSLIPQSILENIPDLYDTERSINPTYHISLFTLLILYLHGT